MTTTMAQIHGAYDALNIMLDVLYAVSEVNQ